MPLKQLNRFAKDYTDLSHKEDMKKMDPDFEADKASAMDSVKAQLTKRSGKKVLLPAIPVMEEDDLSDRDKAIKSIRSAFK